MYVHTYLSFLAIASFFLQILLQLNTQNAQAAQVQSAPAQPSNEGQTGALLDVGGGTKEEEEEGPVMSEEVRNAL